MEPLVGCAGSAATEIYQVLMVAIKNEDWIYFMQIPIMSVMSPNMRTIPIEVNAIIWPEGYLPGFTENFASNEV